jgi:hypothetical protein
MLHGGEMADGTVDVNDPSKFLRNKNGTFEVISPYGYILQVTCHRGSKMEIGPLRELSRVEIRDPENKIWRIRRINAATAWLESEPVKKTHYRRDRQRGV